MKRFLSILLLVACCLTFSASAKTADLDLSTFSEEELRMLCLDVMQELINRQIENMPNFTDEQIKSLMEAMNTEVLSRGLLKKTTLPAGFYEVGVDIPAGKYVLTAVGTNDYTAPQILVYTDMQGFINRNGSDKSRRLVNEILSVGGSCMVHLETGNILYLVNFSFEAEKYNLSAFD